MAAGSNGKLYDSKISSIPSMSVKFNGQELPQRIPVFSISVELAVNRVGRAIVVIKDGRPDLQDFPLSKEDIVVPGSKFEILAGYDQKEEVIFEGIVVRHTIEFDEWGRSVLMAEAMSNAVKMTIGRRNAVFYEKTDQEIIEEIAGNYGLEPEVESTKARHPEMVQYHMTDWDFILSRAEANGLLVVSNGKSLKLIKPDTSGDSAMILRHGENLYDFKGEIDNRYQFTDVQSSFWDYKDQIVQSAGGSASFGEAGNLTSSKLKGTVDDQPYLQQHSGKLSKEEIQSWSDSALLRSKLGRMKGTARIQGTTKLKVGAVVETEGLGPRFNGKLFVGGVFHEYQGGNWETEVTFGFPRRWFYQRHPDLVDPPGSGLVAGFTGLQTGKVKNIHEDPDGEFRVQVFLPMIPDAPDGIWARVATLDAGNERGTFFRPEIEDEVVMGFMHGDPRQPIILGMLHSSSAFPSPIKPEESNPEKGLVTREKMKFIFNDDTISVKLVTPNENRLELHDSEEYIEIEDQHKNIIKMNSSGITIESPKDITIKAKQNINLEAGMNLEAKAKASLKAEGTASSELTSSGPTTVKGTPVLIN